MPFESLGRKLPRTPLAAALAALLASPALAFEVPQVHPDLEMRWDNTFRYNIGGRAQSQDEAILKAPNNDDGDRNFSNGSLVVNRLDILSEFDLVWKKSYGARVSAALWWDGAYGSLDNTNTLTANTLVNGLPVAGELSPYTKRYAKGPSGEFLDAFVFANFDVAGIPMNVKAGQHTVYWGDSLLLGGAIHGVSYAQNSLDVWKGLATPGAEAKELFRPKGGITLQAQATKDLSLAGQWFYNWQAVRYPESGSYLTVNDGLNFGGDSLILGPNPFAAAVPGAPGLLRAWNAQTVASSRTSGSLGDWGISARWSPDWLDGTLGFYYRNATDIQPQLVLQQGFAALPAATCKAIGGISVTPQACIINPKVTNVADLTQKGKVGEYGTAYGDNIHIFALTLSKNIGGVSVGAELSYRENMPLISDPVVVLPAPLVASTPGAIATTAYTPGQGTPGALGNTYHGLVNALWTMAKTPFFDTAAFQAELTWMHWAKVTQNEAVFKGRDSYTAIDKVSRDFVGFALNVTPTWFQVYPGVDLLAPMSYATGLNGNAAVTSGGNESAGNFALGLAADIYSKYRIDLKYTGYFGNYSTNPATGAVTVFNGVNASLSDRGWWSLTFKTTF
ncbi:MAG: DUF1302 domain-containing protein [Burkholderiales bacterium]|nr:DUF1302 domain-containing protein [Burkholderiales bacterium]